MKLVGPQLQRQREVENVLRSLPMWFGIEDSLLMYVADSASMPTFASQSNGVVVAFISLRRHFPQSWEVHCMAVSAAHRNEGIGTSLLQHAEEFVAQQGGRYLQVKTVAASSPSAAYAETRKFYLAKSFVPLEVFPTLWDLSGRFHKYGHMKSRLSPPCVVAHPCRTHECGGGCAPSLAAKSIDFICVAVFVKATTKKSGPATCQGPP